MLIWISWTCTPIGSSLRALSKCFWVQVDLSKWLAAKPGQNHQDKRKRGVSSRHFRDFAVVHLNRSWWMQQPKCRALERLSIGVTFCWMTPNTELDFGPESRLVLNVSYGVTTLCTCAGERCDETVTGDGCATFSGCQPITSHKKMNENYIWWRCRSVWRSDRSRLLVRSVSTADISSCSHRRSRDSAAWRSIVFFFDKYWNEKKWMTVSIST